MAADQSHPVLIVDDDSDIRFTLAFMLLQLAGFPVEEAENGQDALRKIHEGLAPCVILLDLMMPVMDGQEFRLRQLREPEIAHVPVIVFSALHDVETVAAHMGAVAALRKPIDPQGLIAAVAQYC